MIIEETPVSAVILLKPDGSALFQLRDEKPGIRHGGLWAFPGGHAIPGEAPLACAHREFLEETGYRCHDLRYLASGENSRLHLFYDLHDGVQPVQCNEGQEVRFLSRAEAHLFPIVDFLIPYWDQAIALSRAGNPRRESA